MAEKFKVSLSHYTYYALIEDMYKFYYFKDNSTINKNNFLLTLIINFYNYKQVKKQLYIEKFKNYNLVDNIINFIDTLEHDDLKTNYHHKYFTIESTKSSIDILNEILLNEKNETITFSTYIRNMFNEYVKLPMYKRELIMYGSKIEKINNAIANKKEIILQFGEDELLLAPILIEPSFDESYNYLLCKNLKSKNDNCFISFKLSKVKNIVELNDTFTLEKSEITKVNKILKHGIQYATSNTITIKCRLTKEGHRLFNNLNINLPNFNYDEENDIVSFECTKNHFYTHFKSFGKNIVVLEPSDIKDSLKSFYYDSYKIYE